MKKLLFIAFVIPLGVFGQQNLPSTLKINFAVFNSETDVDKRNFSFNGKQVVPTFSLPVFSIFGLANLNQEALKSFNAGGKASMVVRPYISSPEDGNKKPVKALAFYASFNKSASNNDSIVFSKLIFPELGNSAFTGTVQWERYWINSTGKIHGSAFFVEMAFKSVTADTGLKNQKLFFDALNYTIGYRYSYNFIQENPFEKDGKKVNLGFYISPFLSAFNIPDEDRDDYKKILLRNATLTGNADNLSDFVLNMGVKTGFNINGLTFFADMRHVLSNSKVPLRELKGFHVNIGFVFNADILNFY